MKNAIFLLMTLFFVSCQHTQIQEYSSIEPTNMLSLDASSKTLDSKRNIFSSRLSALDKNNDDLEEGNFFKDGVHLITHNSFAFLKFADIEIDDSDYGQLDGYVDITEEYSTYSGTCKVYALDDESILREFEYLIGAEFTLNNYNREQVTAKVEKLVLVFDPWVELPYIAAAFEQPDELLWRYYGWTSRVGATNYPFMSTGEFFGEEGNEEVLLMFQNTVEFSQIEELFAMPDANDYTELKIHELVHFNGVKYHVVQYNSIGGCGSLINNLTAIYKEVDGDMTLMAMDEIDHYFHDLIDVNGDGYPEFMGADFSSSSIYSIENGEFKLMTEIGWSIDECPC